MDLEGYARKMLQKGESKALEKLTERIIEIKGWDEEKAKK